MLNTKLFYVQRNVKYVRYWLLRNIVRDIFYFVKNIKGQAIVSYKWMYRALAFLDLSSSIAFFNSVVLVCSATTGQ